MKIFDMISVIVSIVLVLLFILLLILNMIDLFGGVDLFILGIFLLVCFFIIAGLFGNGLRVIINKLNEKYDEKHGL